VFCLCQPTDPSWIAVATRDLDAVLADHAHCEMKAATTALSLALKNHEDLAVVTALTALAAEELDHFRRVVGFLEQRGVPLGLPPVDPYATELRHAAGRLQPTPLTPVIDRLLIGALIEARSCERFRLLLDHWPEGAGDDLRDFYRELFECEARHYVQYRELAVRVAGGEAVRVEARLRALAEAEGELVARLGRQLPTATVHG
jgi:tRNA-(ms[2]io[6]A)-hydroxylase